MKNRYPVVFLASLVFASLVFLIPFGVKSAQCGSEYQTCSVGTMDTVNDGVWVCDEDPSPFSNDMVLCFEAIDAVCGSSSEQYSPPGGPFISLLSTDSNLCTSGTPINFAGSEPWKSNWNWTCLGWGWKSLSEPATNSNCSAQKKVVSGNETADACAIATQSSTPNYFCPNGEVYDDSSKTCRYGASFDSACSQCFAENSNVQSCNGGNPATCHWYDEETSAWVDTFYSDKNYSCPSGHILSGTSCSYSAVKNYSCGGICSNNYSNTEVSFTSSKSDCSDKIGPENYSLNCTCGAKALPAPAGVDVSLCTSCTKVADPVFSIESGAFPAGTTVSITTATLGASIYYTTNGQVPTLASTLYSGPITISSAVNIKAIGIKTGLTDSGIANKSYTISVGVGCTPTYNNYSCNLVSDVTCNGTNLGQNVRTKKALCTNTVSNACTENVVLPLISDCLANGLICPADEYTVCSYSSDVKISNWKEVSL